jgi:hypothetical protein
MKLRDIPGSDGEMVDFDMWAMEKAKVLANYLQSQPSFRWWNKWYNKPKSLKHVGKERADERGYSPFLGWDSFVCRNPRHPVAQLVFDEFKRVFGRDATFGDT